VRRWGAAVGAPATKALIALNVVVFLLTSLEGGVDGRGGGLQADLALFGPALAAGEWYRVVTTGFVHYGLLHLGFNMLLLYQFGSMLEPALGHIRFVALYTGALLMGSFGALVLDPLALTGGASGAVFGLVGAVAVGMRQRGINVWQSGVGGLLVVNLVITFAVPGISIGGHVGGLAGGATLGAVMLRSAPSRRAVLEGVVVAAVVAGLAVFGADWAAHR
jgi:membrane associated rhomboid family serine protease